MLSKAFLSVVIVFFVLFQEIKAQCCNYRLTLMDNYGDGWNGASLDVLLNGSLTGTYICEESLSNFNLQVCSNDVIDLVFNSGAYDNEITYLLQDSSYNSVFQDGPSPAVGPVFSQAADCNTPAQVGNSPCNAIPLTNIPCFSANNTGFSSSGINPTCSDFQGGDIWFSMIVPQSGGVNVKTENGTLNDTGINAWGGGNCNQLQNLGCDDDSGEGYYSSLLLYDLVPNDTIYIQVFGYGGAVGSFDLCTSEIPIVNLTNSELPIVMINTLGQTIVENSKINCLMDIKYNGANTLTSVSDSSNIYSGNIGTSIRGLTSAAYPQHPYSIETRDSVGGNLDVSILGMPAENDWVLLSNFNDRSLLKNLLSYKIFGEMGNYSVKAQLCEVLIDSSYQGIYVIGEKVKRDVNRVNISKLILNDTLGDDVSGGYILQQNYWNSSNSFQSNFSPIDHPGFDVHFVYDYPNEETILSSQKEYISAFIDSLETALYSSDFSNSQTGYRKYLDVNSFIDYFLVNELGRSADGFKKSVFFHKDKFSNGGKLKAGPVWDFDWAWKNIDICEIYSGTDGSGWAHKNNDCFTDNYSTGWYVRLLQDSVFRNELRCTYEEYRASILDTNNMFNYIDSMGISVQNAQVRHFQKWPILGVSGPAPDLGPVAQTYYAELDTLKNWIAKRITWLDENIPGLCAPSTVSLTKAEGSDLLNCYPNPTSTNLTIEYPISIFSSPTIQIFNCLGKEVVSPQSFNSQNKLTIDVSSLSSGVYILRFEDEEKIIERKIVIEHK